MAAPASASLIGSGTLTVGGGLLIQGPGGWETATLDYEVTWDGTAYTYLYHFYGLTNYNPEGKLIDGPNISHVITQVSDSWFPTDYSLQGTTAGGVLAEYSDSTRGGSNTGMPSQITGIKWTPTNSVVFTWQIVTLIAPVWGDFFAIDGQLPGKEVYLYNSGWPDQADSACYGVSVFEKAACSGFLLVPDTKVQPPDNPGGTVSEPLTLALFLMKEASRRVPEGEWVVGTGWKESGWPNGRFIARADLDQACPNHPAVAHRVCGHLSSVNSRALSILGIDANTPDVEVDSTGRLTGVLTESAVPIARDATRPDSAKKSKRLTKAIRKAHSLGVTSIQDTGIRQISKPTGMPRGQESLEFESGSTHP